MKFYIDGFFEKSVEKIQAWLQSDKNNVYFTWRPKYVYDMSLISSSNQKRFRQKL
jgi:phage-related protein